eukprot:749773-Hanusia_phi.AAC.13
MKPDDRIPKPLSPPAGGGPGGRAPTYGRTGVTARGVPSARAARPGLRCGPANGHAAVRSPGAAVRGGRYYGTPVTPGYYRTVPSPGQYAR